MFKNKPCVYCQQARNHHRSLCPKKFPNGRLKSSTNDEHKPTEALERLEVPQVSKQNIETEQSFLALGARVLMQTVRASFDNPENSKILVKTRMLFDCGSHRTYVTQRLFEKLQLQTKNKEKLLIYTFGNLEVKEIETQNVEVSLLFPDQTFKLLHLNVVPLISGSPANMFPLKISMPDSMKHLKFADDYFISVKFSERTVNVLIGNDYYNELILPGKSEISSGLFLLDSKFGKILTGRLEPEKDLKNNFELMQIN